MRKVIIQGLVILILFFGALFTLRQIDWMSLFKVEQATKKTEEILGDLFWKIYNESEDEINNPYIKSVIDSIVTKICIENDLDRNHIQLHIINKKDINAFALPNGHLVIYKGLILASENQEEVAGVIGHEIAHIELNHVMQKLVKEVGLSMLISMTTGSGNSESIKETIQILSSTAFDRILEKDADIKAVDYLIEAKINSEPFANFLYRLSDSDSEITKYLTWARTHPESKERAEYIIEYIKDKATVNEPVLRKQTWEKLIEKIQE